MWGKVGEVLDYLVLKYFWGIELPRFAAWRKIERGVRIGKLSDRPLWPGMLTNVSRDRLRGHHPTRGCGAAKPDQVSCFVEVIAEIALEDGS